MYHFDAQVRGKASFSKEKEKKVIQFVKLQAMIDAMHNQPLNLAGFSNIL